MDNAISDYHKWKQQGASLRTQAKQAMESRFRDLLTEAARISQEYQADFGSALKPPPQVTAFRFKAPAGKGPQAQGKKTATRPEPAKEAPVKPAATPAPSTPKTTALEKRLAQARTKLEAAKKAGKPTRNLEDKVYEIEDELRLATQAS